jgi:2',3'-cyclic-nucleotide 2'-phosphodiesterase (5'-nucleotidase family)
MEYAKVEGHSHLLRDSKTNSIINTNMIEYQEYLNRRSIKTDENQKVQTIEEEVYNIKNDISEIKSLLKELLKQ